MSAPLTAENAPARVGEARAYIAKTLDNVNGQTFEWQNSEVVSLLLDVMSLLEGRDI